MRCFVVFVARVVSFVGFPLFFVAELSPWPGLGWAGGLDGLAGLGGDRSPSPTGRSQGSSQAWKPAMAMIQPAWPWLSWSPSPAKHHHYFFAELSSWPGPGMAWMEASGWTPV